MQLINQTLATTTDQIKELVQHCIIHEIEGPVNLTFQNNGDVHVWQPDNMPIAESVAPTYNSLVGRLISEPTQSIDIPE
jgi:hypothetical protein